MPLSQIKLPNFTIELGDRWQVYHRLQELGIPCHCSMGQPLWVTVNSPTDALQVWSVARIHQQSRQDLAQWLERCLGYAF